MMRLALVLGCLALPLQGAAAPGAEDTANRAARALDQAAVALRDAGSSSERVAALTRSVRAYEEGLALVRDALRETAAREAHIEGRLAAERAQLGQLLGALQAMGAAPEAALLLHPAGPEDTARAGMLLHAVTPAIADRVASLRADLDRIEHLRTVREAARADLVAGLRGAQDARASLGAAMASRRPVSQGELALEARLKELGRSSETLAAFAAGLPKNVASRGAPDFAGLRGDLALPVAGDLQSAFNTRDAAGIARPGWVLATAPDALVTAPATSTIRYRGPLLDYGNVMILEPGSGYLMVLAGLGSVYGAPGDTVPAGAPLGLMPGGGTNGGSGQSAEETLYVEVRQGNAPVDPAEWFAPAQE